MGKLELVLIITLQRKDSGTEGQNSPEAERDLDMETGHLGWPGGLGGPRLLRGCGRRPVCTPHSEH